MAKKCWSVVVALGVFSVGCAAHQPPAESTAVRPVYQTDAYEDARCAALVFDPPVMSDQPRLEFSRDERQPSAYGGFDDPAVTTYDVQTDDNFTNCPASTYYQRRTLMDRVGVNTR